MRNLWVFNRIKNCRQQIIVLFALSGDKTQVLHKVGKCELINTVVYDWERKIGCCGNMHK